MAEGRQIVIVERWADGDLRFVDELGRLDLRWRAVLAPRSSQSGEPAPLSMRTAVRPYPGAAPARGDRVTDRAGPGIADSNAFRWTTWAVATIGFPSRPGSDTWNARASRALMLSTQVSRGGIDLGHASYAPTRVVAGDRPGMATWRKHCSSPDRASRATPRRTSRTAAGRTVIIGSRLRVWVRRDIRRMIWDIRPSRSGRVAPLNGTSDHYRGVSRGCSRFTRRRHSIGLHNPTNSFPLGLVPIDDAGAVAAKARETACGPTGIEALGPRGRKRWLLPRFRAGCWTTPTRPRFWSETGDSHTDAALEARRHRR